jgi:hypothetical protein
MLQHEKHEKFILAHNIDFIQKNVVQDLMFPSAVVMRWCAESQISMNVNHSNSFKPNFGYLTILYQTHVH